uniref:Maturation protein n=1 Tax=Beihai levi-like virus 13 TaxID=1922398 RepID=A0A1L3KI90_9VIRU|nr:hypothetical protein [Beihai levi-like virus 13]
MSNLRLRDDPLVEEIANLQQNTGGGWYDHAGPFQVSAESRSFLDYNTPRFNLKIRQGKIINNPCKLTIYERSSDNYPGWSGGKHPSHSSNSPNGYNYEQQGPVSQHWLNAIGGVTVLPHVIYKDIVQTAKHDCLKRIDSTPYAFAEDLFEVKQTLQYLKNPLASIAQLIRRMWRAVKKLSVDELISIPKALSQVWLEYRFAFMPLVRSIISILEAYSSKDKTRPKRLSSHGIETQIGNISGTFTKSNVKFSYSHVVRASAHATVLYEVLNPIQDFRFRYGLRLKDLPETIWAVMPYSFMVDRVSDISGFVRGVTNIFDPSLRFLAASVTTKVDDIFSYQFAGTVPSGGWTTTANGDVVTTRNFTYQRDVWKPSLLDTLPDFNLEDLYDEAFEILDIVALLLQKTR